jgi:hypothetical protein
MRTKLLAGAALAGASLIAGAAAADPGVEFKNAAVRVTVLPENRSDIEVTVYRANPRLPLTIERYGDTVVVDGHLVPFFLRCHGEGANLHAAVLGKGDFSVGEFPQVLVKTPMNAVVGAGGVVQGSIAHSSQLELSHSGCGDWTVGNVDNQSRIHVSGVGEVRAGSSGTSELDLSGSGRLTSTAVRGPLEVRISGSGDVNVRSAGSADLSITGSGAVHLGQLGNGLQVRISGAGGLDVASLDGPLTAQVSGVGNVNVPAGHVSRLEARLSGAGNVRFGGVADDLDAEVSGMGSVDVAKVTGSIEQHVSGVGSVHIGGR